MTGYCARCGKRIADDYAYCERCERQMQQAQDDRELQEEVGDE